eukprot:GEMP01055346.1.p1 GENE.GEMP01055346.1~~GEMP01055346.1.p1  ORF type:complete len:191 (+),score=30.51 GEMP01055346.1:97-669(+)
MSAAPLKPWQRRQGAGTLTESLPPLSGAAGGILSAMEYPAHSSSSTATFPSLPIVTSSSNAYPAMSSSTGVPPRSSSAVGTTSLAAPSGTIASGASAAAPSNIGSMATAGGASSSTAGIGTSAIPNPATGLGTPGYSSSYGSSYGGYGFRYGTRNMEIAWAEAAWTWACVHSGDVRAYEVQMRHRFPVKI